ncbi:MAG: hypothetical protein JWO66_1865 [Candidatus Eremiobacteraeota bacterium]|nr:hypothetical protein [Candidatus Eremiobacteraeota bacterium]
MTPARAFAIVCAGGGPRAAAALRARFPGVEFRFAGPMASAPWGIRAEPSPAAALQAVQAGYAIVVDPVVLLDPAAAEGLLAAVGPRTAVTPVLTAPDALVAAAGVALAADAVRGRATAYPIARGAETSNLREMPEPDAFDGRCVAARTETLRAIAPDACGAEPWLEATAAARGRAVAFAVAPVFVRLDGAAVAPAGDDPRDASSGSALYAHAPAQHAGFAADAATGHARRSVRTPYGHDMSVLESAPAAVAVVVGSPADRDGFERRMHANALKLGEIVYASGADAVATADRVLGNRGDRYVAFVDARTTLGDGWLDALAAALERDPFAAFATFATAGCDARATLVAANRIPLSVRLGAFETVHGALADLALRVARERGRGVARVAGGGCTLPRPVDDVAFAVRYGCAPAEAEPAPGRSPRFSGIASIVMLSWNAPEYTRTAVESIRAHTRYPHEIVVVDNGSEPPTLAVLDELERDHGVRVVRNDRNLGFGQGMNVGMAHARGDVVVILNNDVVVTEGWLEDLVGGLEDRRTAGCTAPRSNRVASEQMVGVQYPDIDTMHRFAAERRRALRGRGFVAQRVVGFCLCLDREVIDTLGGFDPLFGLGNYEDDDLCVRMRAAGWEIFVCDDVFIHHFGSVSFKANALDHRSHMQHNWDAFCAKWGLPPTPLSIAYDVRSLGRRGFERGEHVVPLPVVG